ncbi:MAG: hypothetical protein V1792_09795 [Pseudomonadota bacterium]
MLKTTISNAFGIMELCARLDCRHPQDDSNPYSDCNQQFPGPLAPRPHGKVIAGGYDLVKKFPRPRRRKVALLQGDFRDTGHLRDTPFNRPTRT